MATSYDTGNITEKSANGLRRETWVFVFIPADDPFPTLRVSTYTREERASQDVQWHTAAFYKSGHTSTNPLAIPAAHVPLPPRVSDEARRRFADGLAVSVE